MAQRIIDLSTGYTAGTPTGRIGTGATTAGGGNTGWGSILIPSSDGSRILAVNEQKDRIKIFFNSNTSSSTWSLETIIIPLTNQTVVDIKMNEAGSKIYVIYNRSSDQKTSAKCEIFSRSGTTWTLVHTISSGLKTEGNPDNDLYEDFIIIRLDTDTNNRIFIGNDNGPAWEGAGPKSSTSKIYVLNATDGTNIQTLYTTAEYSWSLLTLTTLWNSISPPKDISKYPYMANKNYASVGIKDIIVTNNKINVYFNNNNQPWQFNYNGTYWRSYNLDPIGCPGGPPYIGSCSAEIPGEDGVLKFNTKKGVIRINASSNTDAKIFYNYQLIGSNYQIIDFEYTGDDIDGSSSSFLNLASLINFYEKKLASSIIFAGISNEYVFVSYGSSSATNSEYDRIYLYKRKAKNSPGYYATEDYRWELIGILSPNTTSTNWVFGKNIFTTKRTGNGDLLNTTTPYGDTHLIVSAEKNGNGKAYIYDSPIFKPYIKSVLNLTTKLNGSVDYLIEVIRDDQKSLPNPPAIAPNEIVITNLPSGLTYNNNLSNPRITGTMNATGTFLVNIKVINNGFIDEKILIIYSLGIDTNGPIYGKIKSKFVDFKFQSQGSPESWAIYSGSLPPGMFFDTNAGILYGTPSQFNTYPITIRISKVDKYTNNTITFDKDFVINIAPEIDSDLYTVFSFGEPVNYDITLSNSSGSATCTFEASGLPTGLTLNSSTGKITGTPTVSGIFSITLKANTSYGLFDFKILKMNILKITSNLEVFGKIGQTFLYRITGDGDPSSFEASNLPENFYLFGDIILGNPFFSNQYIIPIKIKKENKEHTANLILKVSPFITDGGVTEEELNHYTLFNQNLTYKIPILNPTSTTNIYTYTIVSTDNQSLSVFGLSLNTTTGTISGTPNFIGKKSFKVTISNAGGSYTKILNIYTLKITSPSTAIAIYGKTFVYQIQGESNFDYFEAIDLPNNFYLFGDTIIGISTSFNISHTINLKAFKNGIAATQNLNLTIIPGLISDTEVFVNSGADLSYFLVASVQNPIITIINKPNWLNYNIGNKTFSGKTEQIGEYEINLYINSYSDYPQKIKIFVTAKDNDYVYKNKYNFYDKLNSIGNSRVYIDDEVKKNMNDSIKKLNDLYKKIRC